MRPEWFEAARYRRWGELLDWAKRQPSLELYEFVETMSETIDTKPDRKALKQVLFVLKGKGVSPAPISGAATPLNRLPAGTRALISAGNSVGEFVMCTFLPGAKFDRETRWLLHEPWGYIRTKEVCFRRRDIELALRTCKEGVTTTTGERFQCVEIDPSYAFWRLGQIWARRHKRNEYNHDRAAYARLLELAKNPVPHPALDIPSAKLGRADCLEACRTTPGLMDWMIPINIDTEFVSRIHALRWDSDLTIKERHRLAIEAFEPEFDTYFHDLAFDWYELRLLDHAHVKHALGHFEEASKIQAVREDLSRLGPKSAIVQHAIETTTMMHLAVDFDEVEEDTMYATAA